MTYVVKRAPPQARPRAYVEADRDLSHVWAATTTVHPDDDETAYIGLVTASGEPIHKQVKQPAGFVRHKG